MEIKFLRKSYFPNTVAELNRIPKEIRIQIPQTLLNPICLRFFSNRYFI